MEHSKNFAFWQMAFNLGWADKEQIRFVTSMGDLSEDEFDEIIGAEGID